MRQTSYSIFAACVVIGFIGKHWIPIWDYVFGGVSQMWRDIVIYLQALDQYLISIGMFPSMIAIGVIGLVLTYEWPRIISHIWRWDAAASQFAISFDANAPFRSGIWDITSTVYAKSRNQSWPMKFAEFVDEATVPSELPLAHNESLADWAAGFGWSDLDQRSFELMSFLLNHFYDPQSPRCSNDELDMMRQSVSKFWNSAGLQMESGKLRARDIEGQIRSASVELKLMAFLEMAKSRQERWDMGPGKRGLFYIAHKAEESRENGNRKTPEPRRSPQEGSSGSIRERA